MARVSLAFFAKHQSELAAKDMTAHGPIPLVDNGARIEQRRYITKGFFDLPQFFVV